MSELAFQVGGLIEEGEAFSRLVPTIAPNRKHAAFGVLAVVFVASVLMLAAWGLLSLSGHLEVVSTGLSDQQVFYSLLRM